MMALQIRVECTRGSREGVKAGKERLGPGYLPATTVTAAVLVTCQYNTADGIVVVCRRSSRSSSYCSDSLNQQRQHLQQPY